MDFKERTRLKIALSQMNDDVISVNKQNQFKISIGFVACLIIMFSGIVYAKDIERIIRDIFTNSTVAIDVAVENGYIQENISEYTYDQEIGIKVDSLILDDLNLNVAFNFKTKLDNVKSIRFNNFYIKTNNNKTLYDSNLEYTEKLNNLLLYKTISWMNKSVKINDITFRDSIIFGLRDSSEEITNLYFYINSLDITYEDNQIEVLEGNWNFEVEIDENMRKTINDTYILSEKNEFIKNCVGTLSPTGMVMELEFYQVFDIVKYIEDNMNNLNDTGLFYIKYNNELLLPSLVEAGDFDGYKFIIHYDNIGTFFENIENIEIVNFNRSSVVIRAKADDCSFNEYPLTRDHQYTIYFETLDRSGNDGEEHFMQKQCAKYLTSHKECLLEKFREIIDNN